MTVPLDSAAPAPTPLAYFAKQTVKAFNTNKTSWIGLLIFVVVILLAILAPVLSPYDPNEQNILAKLRLTNRQQAAVYGLTRGWFSPREE